MNKKVLLMRSLYTKFYTSNLRNFISNRGEKSKRDALMKRGIFWMVIDMKYDCLQRDLITTSV